MSLSCDDLSNIKQYAIDFNAVHSSSSSSWTGEVTAEKTKEIGEMTVKLLRLLKTKKSSANEEFLSWLTDSISDGRTLLANVFLHGSSKVEKLEALKSLINLLPCCNALYPDERFPLREYGDIFRLIIVQDDDVMPFCQCIKDLLEYQDMRRNFWEALDVATEKICIFSSSQITNFIKIVNLWGKKKILDAEAQPDMTKFYFCGVREGAVSSKSFNKCLRRIWGRLVQTEKLPEPVHQNLLITLIETFMPRMDRPIFLHDYFMGCLEYGSWMLLEIELEVISALRPGKYLGKSVAGGAIGLLALQGIFVLIQKHNLNYPNIYAKLYSMFTPSIFGAHYKARFYYLSDLFLSSSHLPESLVAGFAKRIARLCVVAPPSDALILLTFVTNLLIRHPGLHKMTTNIDSLNKHGDPYQEDEPEPAQSHALESSLWEIRLLQEHALPGVAAAAKFINRPLPSQEQDMGRLLENNSNDIFEREVKKKMKAPPLTYDRPTKTHLSRPANRLGFSVWEL